LGKLHPLGARVLESLRTIALEAELQGSKLDAPPPHLFDDDAKQATYEKIRDEFKSWFIKFQAATTEEDNDPEGKYVKTERLLDELFDLHKKYIAIAAPTFLSMLEVSHKQPGGPSAISGFDHVHLSTMRETVGTLCSMIEAGALDRGGSSAPRILR
jgi:hypothetical protein